MRLRPFSAKQRLVLTWWCDRSLCENEAIICDGAVRSGKTLCMGLSFFCWAMGRFQGQTFALCARSVGAVRRNMLAAVLPVLRELGFEVVEKVSQNRLDVRFGGRENTFYLFGGRDESAAAGIQGITLAGLFLDEVALMPRSFVEQACARCSVAGGRLWFSCNPEGPGHWFFREWIEKKEEKCALYLHFTMEDNPALSRQVIESYRKRFTGAFYRRFVLGEWVAAEGLVYGFFDESYVRTAPEEPFAMWRISCDYGTVNPTSFGLWGKKDGVWFRVEEYYYNSRREGRQKTDGEYAAELRRLAGGRQIDLVVVDPSAASFIETLRREGWRVRKAKNDVLEGIRVTADLLKTGKLVICSGCDAILEEFQKYRWNSKSAGLDQVRKEDDHAMDDMRYFATTVDAELNGLGAAVGVVERGRF